MAERKLRIVCRLIIVSAAFGACVTAAPVEDARRMAAQLQGQTFTPAPRTVTDLLAENLLEQRRLAEAEVVAREALRRSLESNGKAHPTTARLIGLVGAILAAQGRLADAERLARVGLSTLEGL